MRKRILETYMVLTLLNRYSTTPYEVMKRMCKLGFKFTSAPFYNLFRSIERENFVKSTKTEIPTTKWADRPRIKHTRTVYIYSLTNEGYKEMFRLECMIRIALSCTIDGNVI